MDSKNALELIKGLDRLKKFIEDNWQDLPEYFDSTYEVHVEAWMSNKDEFAEGTRALTRGGMVEKSATDYASEVTRKFSDNVRIRMWTSRDNVCSKVQVGTKLEPVKNYVETGEMREVPIYEWDCNPILSTLADDDD